MIKNRYNVLGIMSGTSLDGIDIAHIELSCTGSAWSFTINTAQTIPYSTLWLEQLKQAVNYSEQQLDTLNKEYTKLLGGIITAFIEKHKITGLDAVCSHGHTILHQPQNGFTLQIGNLPQISKLTGKKVVCDFRVQDVWLGGQGAPLVPIGDRLLFHEYTHCLNLGGFSNISFESTGNRIAFDICPVNTVLNYYAGKLGHEYDNGGRLAASGTIIQQLLNTLNSLEYYSLPYPKSLGIEFVQNVLQPVLAQYNATPQDILATFTRHAAQQIANIINIVINPKVLVTGGGAYNTLLMQYIKELSPAAVIIVPDDKLLQYKEALIFALLGVLKLRDEVNVLSSVTGARHDHSSGVIYNV